MEKHQLPTSSLPTPIKQRPSLFTYILPLLALAALGFHLAQFAPHLSFSHCSNHRSNDTLHWKSCGDGMQCSKLSVPLNWENSTDERRVELSILKRPTSRQKDKLGSLYINPGGPGGSGSYIESAGWFFDKLLDGRYDLISWDPRGVNRTSDHVTCFSSSLMQHLYHLSTPTSLSLPSNFSSLSAEGISNPLAVFEDLERQVRLSEASLKALYEGCRERTGESLAFVGTKSVVRDLEAISRAIDGEGERINFWGMSYGTVIGQYMTSLLPPHRLGKIVMDGVVNATMWAGPWDRTHPYSSLRSISPIYTSFASSCLSSGPENCALAYLNSTETILSSISSLLDSVYHSPVPLPGVEGAPGLVAQAKHVKEALFRASYSVKEWPGLARKLEKALRGDWRELVEGTLPKLEGSWDEAAKRSDPSSNQATVAIRCADASPSLTHPPFPLTAHSLAEDISLSLTLNSPLVGDQFFDLSFCRHWPVTSQSFYDYVGAAKEQEELEIPVLVINQRHDPVTPIGAAELVLQRLGDSARLVQQNGDGHCAIGQASLCTAKIIRAYLLTSSPPSESHTICEVDELPFGTEDDDSKLNALSAEERELLEAWRGAEGLVLL